MIKYMPANQLQLSVTKAFSNVLSPKWQPKFDSTDTVDTKSVHYICVLQVPYRGGSRGWPVLLWLLAGGPRLHPTTYLLLPRGQSSVMCITDMQGIYFRLSVCPSVCHQLLAGGPRLHPTTYLLLTRGQSSAICITDMQGIYFRLSVRLSVCHQLLAGGPRLHPTTYLLLPRGSSSVMCITDMQGIYFCPSVCLSPITGRRPQTPSYYISSPP